MLSLIVPTLGEKKKELERLLDSLEKQSNQDFEVIIVSQNNHEVVNEVITKYPFAVNHIQINKKGLSNARNVGLKQVNGDIVTFSDDDCWYPEDAFKFINDYFTKNKPSIVTFQIYDPISEKFYKDYTDMVENKLSFRQLFKKSSIELFVNLNLVNKEDLLFDIQFGLGAMYPSGEENILLTDLYRKGYAISYFPKPIVYHQVNSIGSRLTEKSVSGKGPLFKRIYNSPVGFVLITLFFAKKYKYLDNPIPLYFKTVKQLFLYKKEHN